MKSHQFHRLLLHARFELDRFGSALERLESHNFPSEVASLLIALQRNESVKASTSLDVIQVDFIDDPDGSAARLVSEYRKLMSRRRFLEVLEKARSDEVPWSLVPSIEQLAQQLLPGYSVLITTTPDMNYMVGWGPNLVTIYLPKLHRANGFLHVLIGHEFFHPIVVDFFKTELTTVKPKLRDDCKVYLAKLGYPTDLFFPQRLDACLSHALAQWEKGLTELMCDMGAAAVFGPSALWTISGFAATQSLNSPPTPENQYYPPWRLRLKTIHDYIVQMDDGITNINHLSGALQAAGLVKHSELLSRCFAIESESFTVNDLAGDPMRELTVKVYEHIEESMDAAREFVAKAASKFPKSWSKTLDEIPSLIGRLALSVPPSELIVSGKQESKTASLTAIITACWIERLVLEESNRLDLIEFRRLCRLMLKAIEDAELKRAFSEWDSTT
jgi:hypothetical protein